MKFSPGVHPHLEANLFHSRVATIDERLSPSFEPVFGQKDDAELSGRRLGLWCKSSASGDWTLFKKRLTRDGLDFDAVLPRLGTVQKTGQGPDPYWLGDIEWISEALCKVEVQFPVTQQVQGSLIPFADLFQGLVRSAKEHREREAVVGELYPLVAIADSALSNILSNDLSALCSPALYERFHNFREASREAASNPIDASPSSDVLYRQFVDHMAKGGWSDLLSQKPVLLRLVATLTRQWITVTREFLVRLNADYDAIREILLGTKVPSTVAHITGEVADRHNCGRSVLVIAFSDELKVVYKPRDLRTDLHWYNLISWLNDQGAPLDLKTPRVLTRTDYGWAEFIDYEPCTIQNEAERFFARTGAWLCILHLFAAADIHEENVIACGAHPVPIDLEMLLQQQGSDSTSAAPQMGAIRQANSVLADSVLATGLLPTYVRDPELKVRRRGGLNDQDIQRRRTAWAFPNSDGMRYIGRQLVSENSRNLPLLNGRKVELRDYTRALVEGFRQYCDFVSKLRHVLITNEVFTNFAETSIRRVLRPTRVYYMLLSRLKDHRYMTGGVEWSAHLDFIARFSNWDGDQEPLWPLQAAERRALSELNIPVFRCPSDGQQISDLTGVAAHTGDLPGWERAAARIKGFDQDEIARQREILRLNLLTVGGEESSVTVPHAGEGPYIDLAPEAIAASIAARLADWAIVDKDSVSWIALASHADSEAHQLAVLGFDLYSGCSGIALFLAAHARVARCDDTRSIAVRAMAPLRHVVRSAGGARFARTIGIGGASGIGSLLYSLSVMSTLLEDEAMKSDANHLVSLFTPDLIASDHEFDLIGGAAGAILGLLRHYRHTGMDEALHAAVRCGEYLLRVGGIEDFYGELCLRGRRQPLVGLSHGSTGFAYALTLLAVATRREDFDLAARNCLEYGRSARSNGHTVPASKNDTWCHGATGQGLARISMYRMRPDESLHSEIDVCITEILESSHSASDTLCCGNFGKMEFLREADTGPHHKCGTGAARLLGDTCRVAQVNGGFALGRGGERYNISFFKGLAGIGYSLLRASCFELPNVLIWE